MKDWEALPFFCAAASARPKKHTSLYVSDYKQPESTLELIALLNLTYTCEPPSISKP